MKEHVLRHRLAPIGRMVTTGAGAGRRALTLRFGAPRGAPLASPTGRRSEPAAWSNRSTPRSPAKTRRHRAKPQCEHSAPGWSPSPLPRDPCLYRSAGCSRRCTCSTQEVPAVAGQEEAESWTCRWPSIGWRRWEAPSIYQLVIVRSATAAARRRGMSLVLHAARAFAKPGTTLDLPLSMASMPAAATSALCIMASRWYRVVR